MSNHAHRRRRAQRPTRSEIDAAARLGARLLGCTCTWLDNRIRPGHHSTDVAHDDDCPAGDAGTVIALFDRRHVVRRRRQGDGRATP